MKARILTRFNALLTFLLGLFGFGMTACLVKYGVPHAELDVSGTITNQKEERLEEICVTIKQEGNQVLPRTYTNEMGRYKEQGNIHMPQSTIDIIVEDPSGVYAPDSIRLAVTYDKSKVDRRDDWNRGKATIEQNFQLKKNDDKTN